jgi:hypothetical protein
MDIDQIKSQNESSDLSDAGIETISADWEVDKAGNVYRSGNKFQVDFADLKDEFKESN